MHECTLRIRRADRSVPLRLQQSDMQKSLKEWSATDNKSHGPKGWWRRRWHKLITRVRNGTNFSPTFWPFGSYKITCIAHRAERHLWAPYIVFFFRFLYFFSSFFLQLFGDRYFLLLPNRPVTLGLIVVHAKCFAVFLWKHLTMMLLLAKV